MVVSHIAPRRAALRARMLLLLAPTLLLAGGGAGCQTSQPVTNRRLIEHQALIDFSGLAPAARVDDLQATAAVPRNWTLIPSKKHPIYSHVQWKSPSSYTGVGALHVRMPFPLSDKTLLWLAKREYTNKANDGRAIREWTDEVGRSWFEAENNKYHVQGYVLTRGFQAWIVYFGYKTGYAPDLAELSIAARAAETFVPDPAKGPAAPANPEGDADAAAVPAAGE